MFRPFWGFQQLDSAIAPHTVDAGCDASFSRSPFKTATYVNYAWHRVEASCTVKNSPFVCLRLLHARPNHWMHLDKLIRGRFMGGSSNLTSEVTRGHTLVKKKWTGVYSPGRSCLKVLSEFSNFLKAAYVATATLT